jgi:lipopolysaccharide transport system ATP-binding protein
VINGRVASLLEVGTGFHNELTGRENVYLNGAILGMSRREIDRKFDEIVDFAGVEKFLDTPIKRYSSGMKVRLAFAVAAYLEPEILIIDEVLAVGDQEFQNKCLGKMQDVATSGRTVLFVSHNMAAVEALCSQCLLLRGGSLRASGEVPEVVGDYLRTPSTTEYDIDLTTHPNRLRGATPLFSRLQFLDGNGKPLSQLGLGTNVCAVLELNAPGQRIPSISVGLHLHNLMGHRITTFHTRYQYGDVLDLTDRLVLRCDMPNVRLMPGTYNVIVALASGGPLYDRVDPATQIQVVARDVYGTGRVPTVKDGTYAPEARWSIHSTE